MKLELPKEWFEKNIPHDTCDVEIGIVLHDEIGIRGRPKKLPVPATGSV